MSATPPARRSRREPNRLHRSTERIEDLLALLLGVMVVAAAVAGFLTGGSVHDAVAERARAELGERTPVTGTVLEDTAPLTGPDRSVPRTARVRWTGRDGLEHTATTPVEAIRHAGEPVQLWEDRSGRLMPPPATSTDAVGVAVVIGALTGVSGVGTVLLLGHGMFTCTARRFARAWEQEWERVGPEWSGRARS